MSGVARLIRWLAGVAAFSVAAPALAQRPPVIVYVNEVLTIRADNADRRTLLAEFARVTGVTFVAGAERLNDKVTLDVEAEPFLRGLATLLNGTDYIVRDDPAGDGSPRGLRVWIRGRSGAAAAGLAAAEESKADADDQDPPDDAVDTDDPAEPEDPDDDGTPEQKPADNRPRSIAAAPRPGMPTITQPKKGSMPSVEN